MRREDFSSAHIGSEKTLIRKTLTYVSIITLLGIMASHAQAQDSLISGRKIPEKLQATEAGEEEGDCMAFWFEVPLFDQDRVMREAAKLEEGIDPLEGVTYTEEAVVDGKKITLPAKPLDLEIIMTGSGKPLKFKPDTKATHVYFAKGLDIANMYGNEFRGMGTVAFMVVVDGKVTIYLSPKITTPIPIIPQGDNA